VANSTCSGTSAVAMILGLVSSLLVYVVPNKAKPTPAAPAAPAAPTTPSK